ncbi:hypothetical protein B0O80DRAFT_426532 [Mortierella sp. GBAus27b]|nr:hypothetical protein B0O80DRAFT_426532 [Mortierella sp. GBAus27b]
MPSLFPCLLLFQLFHPPTFTPTPTLLSLSTQLTIASRRIRHTMNLVSVFLTLGALVALAVTPSSTWAQSEQVPPPAPPPSLIRSQGCTGNPTVSTADIRTDANILIQYWNNSFPLYDTLVYPGKVSVWTCRTTGMPMPGHERTMLDCSQAGIRLWDKIETQIQDQNTTQDLKTQVQERCYIQVDSVFLEWNKRQ